MTGTLSVRLSRVAGLFFSLTFLASFASEVEAGGLFHRRSREVVVTSRPVVATSGPVVATSATGTLGTFTPTPYIVARGSFPAGGGYSPLGLYGDTTMSLYGPTSAFRSIAAPVPVYVRGYDGRTYVAEGTSFSTPNMPALSPVVYPTQGSRAHGFSTSSTPPWWKSGINWVDQN
jgi:hypothetical protein